MCTADTQLRRRMKSIIILQKNKRKKVEVRGQCSVRKSLLRNGFKLHEH